MKKRYIFTCGDINGIGPEIVIKSLNRLHGRKGDQFIFMCPLDVFKKTSSFVRPSFKPKIVKKTNEIGDEGIILFDIGRFRLNPGSPTRSSGRAAYIALEIAAEILKANYAGALVTAPLSKEALNAAGYSYPGHTEMLAEWFETTDFAMMFLSRKLRAALVTIHSPLSRAAGLVTKKKLESVAGVVVSSLKNDFGITSPSVGVLGLNPHAGESGLIGHEEERIIKPLVHEHRWRKYLEGPYSPDAYWGNRLYEKFDLTLGMYHDQVLIPFKLLNFSKGVNYTAGLPVIRTSPDHGTAFDKAGKNAANENSMLEAFHFAEIILKNRLK
jgi:4-hydroxythreonine-4-phosphate dehydrogenase